MLSWYLSIILTITALALHVQGEGLRVGAFNVQHFSQKKLDNGPIATTLIHLLSRYDVLFLQEMFGGMSVLQQLRDRVEAYALQHGLACHDRATAVAACYGLEASPRQGVSRERFAYLYRRDKVTVQRAMAYNGTWSGHFERPPYIAALQVRPIVAMGARHGRRSAPNLVLIGAHLKPANAVPELQALAHTYNDVRATWPSARLMILGDLNADCDSVRKKEWGSMVPRTKGMGHSLHLHRGDKDAKTKDRPNKRRTKKGSRTVSDPSHDPIDAWTEDTVDDSEEAYDVPRRMKPRHRRHSSKKDATNAVPLTESASSYWFSWLNPFSWFQSRDGTRGIATRSSPPPRKRRRRSEEEEAWVPDSSAMESSDADEEDDVPVMSNTAPTKRRRPRGRLHKRAYPMDEAYVPSASDEDSDTCMDEYTPTIVPARPRGSVTPVGLYLHTDPAMQWLIPTGVDTTVTRRRACTLDRIVMHAVDMDVVLPRTAQPFYYPLLPAMQHDASSFMSLDLRQQWYYYEAVPVSVHGREEGTVAAYSTFQWGTFEPSRDRVRDGDVPLPRRVHRRVWHDAFCDRRDRLPSTACVPPMSHRASAFVRSVSGSRPANPDVFARAISDHFPVEVLLSMDALERKATKGRKAFVHIE